LVSSVEQSTENIKNWCHQWSKVQKTWKLVSSVEQSTENMKTGVISGAEYRKHKNWGHQSDGTSFHVFGTLLHWWYQFSCFRYSAPLMTPVFMFSVFFSTDDTSFYVFVSSVEQSTKNMKTDDIGGAEYRKHENWCHQWSRVPKTWKLVSSVEQIAENMSTDGTSFHDFGSLLHWWHQFSCFSYSAPLMTPVFMF
jgi:hypothetical protein